MMDSHAIFNIKTPEEFEAAALKVFNHQYKNNCVYKDFCNHLNVDVSKISKSTEIPFLPIQFFKSHKVISSHKKEELIFSSSGTTGTITSKHYVSDLHLYEKSYLQAFKHFYGAIDKYSILALLPSYLERKGSSLVYMVDDLIQKSRNPHSGFYLYNTTELINTLNVLDTSGKKVLLIGVSFALLDLIEQRTFQLKNTIIMETGGMKGRRKELIREELHSQLKKGFGVSQIHSEYGMTELLSQAYSKGNGIFTCPPWMKIIIRDTEDPLSYQSHQKNGGVNIIDLANIHSCSFIATQDLGKNYKDDTFEILGRYDNSDIRGCNLLVF